MDKRGRATRRDCIELIQERKLKAGFFSIGGIDRLVIGDKASAVSSYDQAYALLCELPFEEVKEEGVDLRSLPVEDRDKTVVAMMQQSVT